MKKKSHWWGCRCGYEEEGDVPEDNKWYIKSPEYNNCFWTYLRYNSRPHTLLEIAELTGLSISAITIIERKALKDLKKKALTLNKKHQK